MRKKVKNEDLHEELKKIRIYLEKEVRKRKQAEEKLQENEEKLKKVFEFVPDAYYMMDLKGVILDCSKSIEELSGYKKEEVAGKSYAELKLLPLNQMPKAASLLARNALGKHTGPDEFTHNRKDGSQVQLEIHHHPVNVKGQTVVFGIIRDITQLKRTEDSLRESEVEKQAILDASIDRIRLADRDLRILWANKTTTRELDITPKEIIGKTCYEVLVGRDSPCPGCPAVKSFKTGHIQHAVMYKAQSKTTKGEAYWDVYSVPIKTESGDIKNIIQVTRNITEQKKAEEELKKERDKLQDALDNVKTLHGLIPICAHCKKIRDDKGYWNQIESYIHDHSEADFSHSICPECERELYPDYFEDDET